ncbi:MAG TPA: extracellular solute-binding protein [Polyangia bacterium]|nr:extracellular solute-binding protein [Polyangia bacterium]
MISRWVAFAALLAIVAVPFAVRPRGAPPVVDERGGGESERLVIVTPHQEPVRFEFGRAFREWMAARGRRVEIDWRTPGGTVEIARYLASEYTASFRQHWTGALRRPWSARIAAGFMTPPPANAPPALPGDEVAAARQVFLDSDVGCGLDVFFGGGSVEHTRHARAGRLVDAGLVGTRPDLFGPEAIPQQLGGQALWDKQGRWMGACIASFGMCFNRDTLGRLGLPIPSSWAAMADPRLHDQVAIADPSKSGSVGKSFETIIQAEMAQAGVVEGWARAMRLIRRIGGNARYFTDSAAKVALDVSAGDAAIGTCIDFYGRFERETLTAIGHPERVGYVAPRGETALDADPISLLRGAPHRELAVTFIAFVLSDEGQKLWAFRRGAPGGPQRYTLARLPMAPRLYGDEFADARADLGENPFNAGDRLDYHEAWTAPLFGAIAFVVRTMCVDTEPELKAAYRALAQAGFPPAATAAFDDLTLVDHATVSGPIARALRSVDPLAEAAWSRRLVEHHRALYRRVAALARAGR